MVSESAAMQHILILFKSIEKPQFKQRTFLFCCILMHEFFESTYSVREYVKKHIDTHKQIKREFKRSCLEMHCERKNNNNQKKSAYLDVALKMSNECVRLAMQKKPQKANKINNA